MTVSIGVITGTLQLVDNFSTGLTRAATKLEATGKKMEASGRRMTAAGSALTKSVTLPIVAMGAASVISFGKFDAAMTQSLAIMGDVSDTMRKDMADAAREVAKVTTFSATEAAESYFFLASAGLDAEASLLSLPAVAKFAQAGMFDMALATDLLTDAQSALGLTIRDDAQKNMENMIRVSDVFVKANTLANATVEQFSTALTREAGAALRSFGKDVEEGVAVLAAFADQGVKGEIAGTGLSRIMRLMSAAAVKNRDAYEKLNVEVFDADGKMRNFADIVEDLENALGHMSDESRTVALDMLGFKARVQGVILPLLGTSDAIRRYEGELRNAGGTTQEVAQKQMQTLFVRLGLLKDRIVDVFITLGQAIEPVLNNTVIPAIGAFINKIAELAEWFANLPESARATIVGVAALAAAIGPLLVLLGSLVTAFGAIAPGIATVLTFISGPVGMTAAAIALLAAWKPFRDFLLALVGGAFNVLKAAIMTIIDVSQRWWAATEEGRTFLARLGSIITDNVVFALKDFWQWLTNIVAIVGATVTAFRDVMRESTFVQVATDTLVGSIKTLWDWLTKAISVVWNWVGGLEGILKALSFVVPGLGSAVATLQKWIAQARAAQEQTQQFSSELVEGTISVEAMDQATEMFGATTQEATAAVAGLGEESAVATNDLADLGEEVEDTTTAMTALQGMSIKLINGWPVMTRGMKTTSEATTELTSGFDALEAMSIKLINGFPVMTRGILESAEAEDKAKDSTEQWEQAFKTAIADMVSGSKDLGETLKSIFVTMTRQIFTEFVDTVTSAFTDALDAGEGAIGSLIGAFKEGFKEMGSNANAVTAGIGAAAGDWQDIGIGALSAISAYAQGNWVGAVVGAVGVVAGVFGKLFGDDEKSLKEQADEAFKALADGIPTVEKLANAANVLAAAMNAVASGEIGAAEGTEILTENFDALVDAAIELGDEGLASLKKVVDAARAAGVGLEMIQERLKEAVTDFMDTLAERNQFLVAQSETLLSGVEQMISTIGRSTRREIEFAATGVLQAFNAMQAAGVPLTEIMEKIGGAFTKVSERGKQMGIELPPEFERLGEVMEILGTKKIQGVIGKLEGMSEAAMAAGNMGLLTAEQFDLFGDKIRQTFNKLEAGGLTSAEAIAALAPQLQNLHDLSQQYGFAVDANTQSLIDQAIAQGVVLDKGMTTEDILVRGFDNMLLGINALIEALGGVPIAFEQMGASAVETSETTQQSFIDVGNAGQVAMDQIVAASETAAAQSTEAWQAASMETENAVEGMADRMRRELRNIPVTFDVEDIDIPGGGGGGGGGGRRAQAGTRFENFGAGTPMVLHGREQVITEAQGAGIANMVTHAIRQAQVPPTDDRAASRMGRLVDLSDQQNALFMALIKEVNRLRIEAGDRTIAAGNDRRWQG